MVLGIVLGGIVPLFFIPILEKYVVKSKNHIVAQDHEYLKKDFGDWRSFDKLEDSMGYIYTKIKNNM